MFKKMVLPILLLAVGGLAVALVVSSVPSPTGLGAAALRAVNPCAAKTINPCAARTINPCAARTINPCAAKTLNPCAAKTLNPCAAKTLNPCAAKTLNPCAAKTLNPCAAKTLNPCAAKTLNPCAAKTLNPCAAKTLNPCAAKTLNPCAAKTLNPCTAKTLHPTTAKTLNWAVDPSRFTQPAGVALAEGSQSELIETGRELWDDRTLGRTGLACATCHINNYMQMNPTFAEPYPHYVAMPAQQAGVQEVNAAEMVQFCMLVPMGGDPLDWRSSELAALTAYVESIQGGYQPGGGVGGGANPCNPCGAKSNPCAPKNPCNP